MQGLVELVARCRTRQSLPAAAAVEPADHLQQRRRLEASRHSVVDGGHVECRTVHAAGDLHNVQQRELIEQPGCASGDVFRDALVDVRLLVRFVVRQVLALQN